MGKASVDAGALFVLGETGDGGRQDLNLRRWGYVLPALYHLSYGRRRAMQGAGVTRLGYSACARQRKGLQATPRPPDAYNWRATRRPGEVTDMACKGESWPGILSCLGATLHLGAGPALGDDVGEGGNEKGRIGEYPIRPRDW